MRRRAWLTILLIVITGSTVAQQTNNRPPIAVPDEATAVRIAEDALTKIYGKKVIQSEEPFHANLAGGIWHVGGTLCPGEPPGTCVGGVAIADIRQRDGRVLKTGRTK
ncbi:MAG TPA: NTF2 fold immunity protein [Candidatus Acidoferrales bacterium]|nr:NTF2 fold immunity protein [Candidatus Acidoferrales bacterium]